MAMDEGSPTLGHRKTIGQGHDGGKMVAPLKHHDYLKLSHYEFAIHITTQLTNVHSGQDHALRRFL